MAERRSLIEGMKATPAALDPIIEKTFVREGKIPSEPPTSAPQPKSNRRIPLSTKIREDIFDALKRASLQRQLSGQEPHTIIDIVELAVEPWLKANGYLP